MARNFSYTKSADDPLPVGSAGKPEAVYRIGDLAREFHVTLRTLRFYEDKGLVTPKRSGTTRLYSDSDRTRLKLILFSKRVGFSLIEIRELLELYDAGKHSQKNPLASSRHLFQEKLLALEEQKTDTEHAIEELSYQLSSANGMFAE